MRVAFTEAVDSILVRDARAMFFSGDLGFQAFEGLAAHLGPRFINAGVAEQNMIGVAAGVALTGIPVWVYSIAPFATLRCLEQIRNDVCLHDLPVRIVGNGGGYTYGIMGSTHHALEDLAVLKALPNMQLFFPCSNNHVAAAVETMHGLGGPSYLRLAISGFPSDAPPLSENSQTLTRVYRRRTAAGGVTIIGAGHGVQIALSALALGLDAVNADIFGIARFPLRMDLEEDLVRSVSETGRVLFIEEHYAAGGIGESMRLALGARAREFVLLAAEYSRDQKYGSAAFHLRQCGMTPERVAELAAVLASGSGAVA